MDIIKGLRDKQSELQQQLDTVEATIKLLSGGKGGKRKRRKMSAETRKKMAAAAKKRWADKKSKQKA